MKSILKILILGLFMWLNFSDNSLATSKHQLIVSTYLTAYVGPDAETPRRGDISVSGFFLEESESILKTLPNHPEPVELGDDFPTLQICNSKNTELLTLVFHYGSASNEVGEFRVGPVSKPPLTCIKPPKGIEHFVTGKGIRLGISRKELLQILGPGFTEQKKGKETTVNYKIDDFAKSSFLKKYNMPVYYASYHFETNKLVKFEFGFEHP